MSIKPTTLCSALTNCDTTSCEKLYLSFNETHGWSIEKLGWIDRICRRLFGAYKETHSSHIIKNLSKLSGDIKTIHCSNPHFTTILRSLKVTSPRKSIKIKAIALLILISNIDLVSKGKKLADDHLTSFPKPNPELLTWGKWLKESRDEEVTRAILTAFVQAQV